MRGGALPLLVALVVCLTGCGAAVDEAAAIHGTWTARYGVWDVYESFRPDGTWEVRENDEEPHDWGTYTLEDGVLTMTSDDDGWCEGGVGVYEVTFTDGGTRLTRSSVVPDECSEKGTARWQIATWTKHTP